VQRAFLSGRSAVVDPGNFAAYVFTIVAAVGSISVIGAVVRKIAGPRRPLVLGMPGVTDPGQQDAVRQLTADVDAMREEITGLRRELDETLNRLDFTERLLGQAKERGLLSPPRERGPS
jgi:hypothetical protein